MVILSRYTICPKIGHYITGYDRIVRVTKRDAQLIKQLVLDCNIYNFREKDALEYIKTRLGRTISGRTYRRYKVCMLDGNLTRDWMNYFCRTGYLVQNHQLFSCAKYLLESSMRRLLAEENKEMPDDSLILRMRQDVRDNMRAVHELAAGPPIISQIDSRLQELEDKVVRAYGNEALIIRQEA